MPQSGNQRVILPHAKQPTDRGNDALRRRLSAVAEQVGGLQRGQRAAAADLDIGHGAVIEPHRDEPRIIGQAHPQLLNGKQEFLVLDAARPGQAKTGKTGYKDQRAVADRFPDFRAAILAG